MPLPNGQPVIVTRYDVKPLEKPRQVRGTILSHRIVRCEGSVTDGDVMYLVAIGEPHYFNYEEKEFGASSVVRFIPLSEEDTVAAHAGQLKAHFADVEKAVADLLPGEKIEIVDGSIVGYHGAVTMDPVVYETKRIGAVQETAGWQVTTWHNHPATRVQPEDVSDAPQGTFPWGQAVKKFVEVLFAVKAADYWQRSEDQAQAEAWAAGEM